jgi:hypothetical protein
MKDQITQVDITYNGSIVILGEINGMSVHWVFTQKELLKLLKKYVNDLSRID